MNVSLKLNQYKTLLHIRHSRYRRNFLIVTAVFILTLVFEFAIGMLEGLEGREIYLIVMVDAALGFAVIAAWVRLEINRAVVDILENLS